MGDSGGGGGSAPSALMFTPTACGRTASADTGADTSSFASASPSAAVRAAASASAAAVAMAAVALASVSAAAAAAARDATAAAAEVLNMVCCRGDALDVAPRAITIPTPEPPAASPRSSDGMRCIGDACPLPMPPPVHRRHPPPKAPVASSADSGAGLPGRDPPSAASPMLGRLLCMGLILFRPPRAYTARTNELPLFINTAVAAAVAAGEPAEGESANPAPAKLACMMSELGALRMAPGGSGGKPLPLTAPPPPLTMLAPLLRFVGPTAQLRPSGRRVRLDMCSGVPVLDLPYGCCVPDSALGPLRPVPRDARSSSPSLMASMTGRERLEPRMSTDLGGWDGWGGWQRTVRCPHAHACTWELSHGHCTDAQPHRPHAIRDPIARHSSTARVPPRKHIAYLPDAVTTNDVSRCAGPTAAMPLPL